MIEQLQPYIDTAFYAVVTAGISFMIGFLSKIVKSINSLNEKIAIIIERTDDHGNRISRLEFIRDRE